MSEGGARRPSVVRLKLKFSAFGNAVSLFPKEKYPAAREGERASEGGEFAAPFLPLVAARRRTFWPSFGRSPLSHFECPARLTN